MLVEILTVMTETIYKRFENDQRTIDQILTETNTMGTKDQLMADLSMYNNPF